MVVSHEFKIAIVSLPQFKMEQASDKKCLPGLLGSTCSMTSPVSLTGDFSRDTLTTTIVVIDTPTLHKIPDMSERTETNPIIIPESHVLLKVPVIIPIFDNISIAQGSISDDDFDQSINRCYPLATIWFSAIKYQSGATDNTQIRSSSITEKQARIKRSGILMQHASFETSADFKLGSNFCCIFEQLSVVNSKNKEDFFNIFSEIFPSIIKDLRLSSQQSIDKLDMAESSTSD